MITFIFYIKHGTFWALKKYSPNHLHLRLLIYARHHYFWARKTKDWSQPQIFNPCLLHSCDASVRLLLQKTYKKLEKMGSNFGNYLLSLYEGIKCWRCRIVIYFFHILWRHLVRFCNAELHIIWFIEWLDIQVA